MSSRPHGLYHKVLSQEQVQWRWRYSPVVKCLPGGHEVLGLTPGTCTGSCKPCHLPAWVIYVMFVLSTISWRSAFKLYMLWHGRIINVCKIYSFVFFCDFFLGFPAQRLLLHAETHPWELRLSLWRKSTQIKERTSRSLSNYTGPEPPHLKAKHKRIDVIELLCVDWITCIKCLAS